MKDKKYLLLGLLVADLIAVYFFLRTPVPWIFWTATFVLAVSIWIFKNQWKNYKNRDEESE
ncbi:hypothetical protein N597_01490 [Streptococcus ilei]|jgi:inner membrane protein yohD|uniref:Uncharacterized protein n=1 Tax=Streptococcus xiaochunlingii TaxID=2589788 RepID=A0ABY2YD78_9STRE|nr:hypothetical protein N597_01490 [Streptococcus ilei]AGY40960.1 membrane protein [Streptococcus ilei]RJU23596.1 hypothetical protein DW930_07140 [Streptococcus sp. AM43-2AT]RJU48234.1 hypothetical protein DW738_09970 [Streptococcus sp. AM28-20]TPE36376.1 hypothetical protein FJR71_09680 [Streptococcus xiaochunlingii]